jgi:maleylpyruvate isomerase
MTEIVLHGYYRSSASFRLRIALGLKEIGYRSAFHHLRKGEQRSSAYLALNPQGLVPTLEIDGERLTQSLAALEYLDETYPHPRLLPVDAAGRARVRALAQIVACDIHPIDNLRVLQYLRGPLCQSQASIESWYNHWIGEGFTAIERLLADDPRTGRYCHGDEVTLADVCLIPQVINARNFDLDLSPFPTLRRVAEQALALPAFERALPVHQQDAE